MFLIVFTCADISKVFWYRFHRLCDTRISGQRGMIFPFRVDLAVLFKVNLIFKVQG